MSTTTQVHGNNSEGDLPPNSVLFGKSEVMQSLKRRLSRVCGTPVPVVLQGEMCVGKSVLCRFIHQHSTVLAGQYLRLNCSAFGDWRDYTTLSGALKSCVVAATKTAHDEASAQVGTLFFQHVSDLSPQLQQELSHLLADYDWSKKREPQQEAIRILCTSTKDLRREVKQGRFRRDLFDRLAVVTIEVPPLKKRLADLPEIIEFLRRRYSQQTGIEDDVDFSPDLLTKMLTYSWPGNFCELQNFVRRFVALGPDHCTFGKKDAHSKTFHINEAGGTTATGKSSKSG